MRPKSFRPGAAALEFALVLPVLLTMVLGGIDFGRFPYTHMAVINAAQSGAAYGSMHPYSDSTATAWNAGLRQAVEDEMKNLANYDATQLTLTVTRGTDSGGIAMVRVEVAYPFQPLISWPVPSTLILRQAAAMRMLRG